MRHNRLLQVLMALVLISWSCALRAGEQRAREEWMSGYVRLEAADKAEESGNNASALDLYQQALTVFRNVRRGYPSWNTSLLSYRITFCEKSIERIESNMKKERDTLSKPQLAVLVQRQKSENSEYADEVRTLKERLSSVERALARARREAAENVGAGGELKRILQEKERLEEKARRQSERIKQLGTELSELRKRYGLEDAARKLREELARSKTRMEQLEEGYSTYRKAYENVKSRLGKASLGREMALRKLKEELERKRRQEGQSEVLQEELVTLRAKCASQMKGTVDLQKTIAEGRARERGFEERLGELDTLKAELARVRETASEQANARNQLDSQTDNNKRQEKLLAATRNSLGKTRRDLADIQEKLKAERATSRKLLEASTTNLFEAQRLGKKIGFLKKARDEAEKMRLAAEREAERELARRAELSERTQRAEELVKTLEKERERLEAKSGEQLKLLRHQEADLARFESEKKTLTVAFKTRGEQLDELKNKREKDRTKMEVVTGLGSSLEEADRKLARMKRELASIRNSKMLADERIRELKADLSEDRKELKTLRESGSASHTEGGARLLARLRKLQAQLEKESQRRRSLEAVLASGDESPVERKSIYSSEKAAAPPSLSLQKPLPGLSSLDEKARRDREQLLVVRGYLRQGVDAEKKGSVEAARWNYTKVLEKDPENKIAAQRLGLIAAENGEDADAIRYLHQAFRIDPDDMDTLLPLGFALVRESKPDLALSMLSRAVAMHPGSAAAHRCLGVACSMIGWYGAAEVQFRRTYKLDEKDPENAFNMAVLLATRTPPRMDEAREWYLRAVKLGVVRDPGLDRRFGLEN
ncbi:MAG: tetratricopeptide repeat protein [Lentisphaeria bacterium]|nr:tetratricopeptide repeat protein [Lentisphaeria bacterium]